MRIMSESAPPVEADDIMIVCMKGRSCGQFRNRDDCRDEVPCCREDFCPVWDDAPRWERPWDQARADWVERPPNCVRDEDEVRPLDCVRAPAEGRDEEDGRMRPDLLSSKSNSNAS